MVRRKKHKARGRSKASKRSPQDLAKLADEYLRTRQFKGAIETYKQLLKQEQDPRWQNALAQAYLGWAKDLAGKRMYKEAVALWENMAHLCATQQGFELYLGWLVRDGRYQRAVRLYIEADQALRQNKAMHQVVALMGGLLLTGHSEVEQALPSDEPMRRHLQPLLAALQVYCQGKQTALGDRLREIPFRSPFRDLRQILQALGQIQNGVETTRSLLARIPADSVYARFANVVDLACGSADRLMDTLNSLQPAEIELIATLRGLTAEHTALLKGVQQLEKGKGKNSSPKALFQFAVDHRGALGEEVAERFCRRMLPFCTDDFKAYACHFAPLSQTEQHRITALQCEQHHHDEEASHHWKLCIKHMLKGRGKKDNKLAAALLLRHCVDRYGFEPNTCLDHDPSIGLLQHSLELDPLDKPAYLNLLQRLQGKKHQKQHDRWLTLAVKHLPDDGDLLLAAANAAQQRGAYTKAARFALDIIERDSINNRARQIFVDCQLAQLRKHIAKGKKSAAKKGLATVQAYAQDGLQHALVYLHRGFLALSSGDKDGAHTYFSNAFGYRASSEIVPGIVFDNGLEMGFRLLIEGQCCGFTLGQLQPYTLDAVADGLTDFSKSDILGLIGLLQHYLPIKSLAMQNTPVLAEALRLFHKPLKAAAARDYSEQDLRLICGVFDRIGDYVLLKAYSTTALKRFDRPLFVLFQVLAKCKGNKQLNQRDYNRLMDAEEQAEMEDDYGTAERIMTVLDELSSDFQDDNSLQQTLEQLIGSDDKEGFKQFLRLFGEMGAQGKPRKRRNSTDNEDIPVQGELL